MWAAQKYAPRSSCLRSVKVAAARSSSSSSNPYPYPTHPNPSPYQIFHLFHNASQSEIKQRYIDLVRIYHPDSPVSRALPPEITDGRFQSITKAYDALRAKNPMISGNAQSNSDVRNSTPAAWRARQSRRLDLDIGGDDRWKDRIIFLGAIFAIAAFVAQTMTTRRDALTEMRRQAIHASQNTRTRNPPLTEDSSLDASLSHNEKR